MDQSDEPYIGRPYPDQYATYREFDGRQVFFRPVKPTDEQMMKDLFYSFSEDTIYRRFMSVKRSMPHRELQHFANIDYDTEMAIVGVIREDEMQEIIAVGRYSLYEEGNEAEVAFVVRDDWQGKGIGTFLLDYLIRIGRDMGIDAFTAEVMPQNKQMIHMFEATGLDVETKMVDGTYTVRFPLQSGQ